MSEISKVMDMLFCVPTMGSPVKLELGKVTPKQVLILVQAIERGLAKEFMPNPLLDNLGKEDIEQIMVIEREMLEKAKMLELHEHLKGFEK